MSFKGAVIAVFVLAASTASAMAGEGKWSGEAFGDVYWFAADHDSLIEDQNGMWIRRVNLSYDYIFSATYSARIRIEGLSPGDFTSTAMTVFVKDAWFKWAGSSHAVLAGLQQTPTFNVIESVWGYRSVEKPPVDLQGMGSSRDLGIGAIGTFGASKKLGYHVLLADGSGTRSETDRGKKIMGAVNLRPNNRFVIEGYADYENRTNDADRTTYQGFVGYQTPSLRAGLEWSRQTRNMVGTGTKDVELDIYSGFVTTRVSDRIWAYGRVDRNDDPNPDGANITFVPFAADAPNTFVVGGIDWLLWQEKTEDGQKSSDVHLMPNVEAVFYSAPEGGGPAPGDDVIPRLTFWMRF